MNPFQFPYCVLNEKRLLSASLGSNDLSSVLLNEIQMEKEKNKILEAELDKEKVRSKELEDFISSLLLKRKEKSALKKEFKKIMKEKYHVKTKYFPKKTN